MDLNKAVEALSISIPVFAMMGLGRWLGAVGFLNEGNRNFLNRLTYTFALPALIFSGLAIQPLDRLLNPALIAGTLAAVGIATALYGLLALTMRLKGGFAAAFIFGTFWANVSYMGFPLAANAFGPEHGLAMAAIVNAFTMPVFVILGFLLIGVCAPDGSRSFVQRVIGAFANPVVGAAFAGMLCAFILDFFRLSDGEYALAEWIMTVGRIAGSFLSLVGDMGLPLALIAVGASLRFESISRNIGALSLTVFAKLAIVPLITYGLICWLFPNTDPAARGVAVLLMATPNAVASYVVARQLKVAEEFVSALLVVSTGLSVITIPIWLYIII
jgi:predicted permease